MRSNLAFDPLHGSVAEPYNLGHAIDANALANSVRPVNRIELFSGRPTFVPSAIGRCTQAWLRAGLERPNSSNAAAKNCHNLKRLAMDLEIWPPQWDRYAK